MKITNKIFAFFSAKSLCISHLYSHLHWEFHPNLDKPHFRCPRRATCGLVAPTLDRVALRWFSEIRREKEYFCLIHGWGFPGGSADRESDHKAGDVGSIPGWKGPLEEEMAIYSSIFAWRTLWTEEPGILQFMGSQRVRQDWAHARSSLARVAG